MSSIDFRIRPAVDNAQLNRLFAAAWPDHAETDFRYLTAHSLVWVCAYDDDALVGFVNMAWDGGIHGFILDTTVDPTFQRRGIGVALVEMAVGAARERGIEWVHVDYDPHLLEFYRKCGFRPTLAGLINLRE